MSTRAPEHQSAKMQEIFPGALVRWCAGVPNSMVLYAE